LLPVVPSTITPVSPLPPSSSSLSVSQVYNSLFLHTLNKSSLPHN
jgi:hypothetical protein